MKKIMSLMLGMSLVLGAASFAFAQDTSTSKTNSKPKKTKGKKGSSGTDTSSKKGS